MANFQVSLKSELNKYNFQNYFTLKLFLIIVYTTKVILLLRKPIFKVQISKLAPIKSNCDQRSITIT